MTSVPAIVTLAAKRPVSCILHRVVLLAPYTMMTVNDVCPASSARTQRAAVSDELQSPNKENMSDHGCNKHRSAYSKGRECPGCEKTALNNVR